MTTVANNAELMAALSSAAGGDRIELAPGDYGDVSFGQDFTSDVTIVSADPANPAIMSELYIGGASHIVLDGIYFDYTYKSGDKFSYLPFEVRDSSYITIRNSVFDGDFKGDSEYGWGVGLIIGSGSDNIVVDKNEFFNWLYAAAFGQSRDIMLSDNDVHLVNIDGFRFVSVDGVLIEGNHFHDWHSDPDTHRDMIQFWTKINETSSKNITIRGNFFDAGLGEQTQTLFLRNNIVDTGSGSFEDYAYRNFLIEDNVIYNANGHGMTIGATDGLVIQNNTILYDPFAAGPHFFLPPQIRLSQASINVTIDDNILHNAVQVASGWGVGPELIVQRDDPNAPNYYGDLFVNALIQAPTLADLRALPGGLIETQGYGAEMTRSDITLEVGPAPGSDPGPAPEPMPDPDPVPEPDPVPDPEVKQMQFSDLIVNLIDSTDNAVVMRLIGGEFLDPVFMASGDATFGVDLAPGAPVVGSMRLTIGDHTRTEGVAPYALFGDNGKGDFAGGLVLAEGDHTLRLEVFDDGGAAMGDFLVPFAVGVEPVQAIDPAVQAALDALQGKIAELEARVAASEARIVAGAAGLGG